MTLYFSRLTLDRAAPAHALAPLLDPEDLNRAADAHHRLVWAAFADGTERPRDFLWRAEGGGRFLTLSAREPRANGLFEPPEIKTFEPALARGDRLAFALRANATKDRARGQLGKAGRDRRVDVVMDRLRAVPPGERAAHRDAAAQEAGAAWLACQGAAKGFEPMEVVAENYVTLDLDRHRRRRARLGVLDLTGRLRVTEPDAFVAALGVGFGRAKAWGCGLMLIRRA